MRETVIALLSVFSVLFLLGAFGLGLLASRGRVDPTLHGMVAFLAGILAIGIHIRNGGGLDFLAVILLAIALFLGIMGSGGGVSPESHFWVAIFAVTTSAFAQIRNFWSGTNTDDVA